MNLDDINKVSVPGEEHLSPDKLNALGDTFLKKGDRAAAIGYYYRAAEKLYFAQKDKKIAIYKKIIKIAPSESKAYEAIVEIFSRMGLVNEEKRYLMMLVQLYQSKGEYNRINDIYRRIREIDPLSGAAEKYFGKGKHEALDEALAAAVSEGEEPASGFPQEGEGGLRRVDEGGLREEELFRGPDAEKFPAQDRRDQRDEILDYRIEESLEHRPVDFEERKPLPLRMIAIIAGAAVTVLASAVLVWLFLPIGRKGNTGQVSPGKAPADSLISDGVRAGRGAYAVTVRRIGSESALLARLGRETVRDSVFYDVTIRPGNACVPNRFLAAPLEHVAFVDRGGNLVRAKAEPGIEKPVRVIYRTNVCQQEQGAVFVTMILAHGKGQEIGGLSIQGLEPGPPLVVTW